MKATLLPLLCLCPLIVCGDEQATAALLQNGDFSANPIIWQGSGRAVNDRQNKANKVYAVELGRQPKSFGQQIVLDGEKEKLTLSWRMRANEKFAPLSAEKGPIEVQLRSREKKEHTIENFKLEKTGEWIECSLSYDCKGVKTINLMVNICAGKGTLEFDDFVATAN